MSRDRDELIQVIGQAIEKARPEIYPTFGEVEAIADAVTTWLTTKQLDGTAVTLLSQSWEASVRRQKEAIERLQGIITANRALVDGLKAEIETQTSRADAAEDAAAGLQREVEILQRELRAANGGARS